MCVSGNQPSTHGQGSRSHHNRYLPFVDVEVWDVVDIHPLQSAADAAVCASQKHHRKPS